jgi:glucose/arabinose dehydrogenase
MHEGGCWTSPDDRKAHCPCSSHFASLPTRWMNALKSSPRRACRLASDHSSSQSTIMHRENSVRSAIAVFSTVLLLAGCGGGGGGGNPQPSPAAAAPPPQDPPPETPPPQSPPPQSPTPAVTPQLDRAVVVLGLQRPWDLAFTPDGAMLFTEQCRGLSVRDTSGATRRLFGSAGAAVVASDLFCPGQSGMLGVAVDPEFAANPLRIHIYVVAIEFPGNESGCTADRGRGVHDCE